MVPSFSPPPLPKSKKLKKLAPIPGGGGSGTSAFRSGNRMDAPSFFFLDQTPEDRFSFSPFPWFLPGDASRDASGYPTSRRHVFSESAENFFFFSGARG